MKTNIVVLIAVLAIAAGFGGGYFFRNYQLGRARGNFAAGGANGAFQRFNGARGAGQNGAGRGGVEGSILSIDNNSVTVKMQDGSSKIVILSGSTTYSNTASASQSDLKTGATVAVVGTTNSDGSVTATNVQINPMFGRPQGSPNPTP